MGHPQVIGSQKALWWYFFSYEDALQCHGSIARSTSGPFLRGMMYHPFLLFLKVFLSFIKLASLGVSPKLVLRDWMGSPQLPLVITQCKRLGSLHLKDLSCSSTHCRALPRSWSQPFINPCWSGGIPSSVNLLLVPLICIFSN